MHNEGVTNKLEAWLTFLSTDEPEDIVELITKYPEFKKMYEDVYQLCLNMEKVMGMFSEELRMLDANTTQLMIDMMQESLEKTQAEIKKAQAEKEQTGCMSIVPLIFVEVFIYSFRYASTIHD